MVTFNSSTSMIIIYNHALDTKEKVEMMGGEDGDSLSILSSDSVHILAPSDG